LITAFSRQHHQSPSLSLKNADQVITFCFPKGTYIVFSHVFLGLLDSSFPISLPKPPYDFLFSPARTRGPVYLIFLYQVTRRQCDEDNKSSPSTLAWRRKRRKISLLGNPCLFTPQVRFLDAFAELRKTTIGVVMSVCLPVCLSVCPSARPSSWNN